MISVKSKFTLNKIRLKQLETAAITSLEQTGEALHTEVIQAQVVPRDTGQLQNEAFFVDTKNSKYGKVSLVHSTPYARRLYYHPEFNFQKDENSNAKGHWFEDWLKGGSKQDFVPNTFKKLYKRNGGL